MSSEIPSLPSVYDLVMVESVDSVLIDAMGRAESGADEGTLLWAETQRDARTRRGYQWHAPRGNLHCALVLRPDFSRRDAEQLCALASVAAGAAIAEVVSPMTGMGFAWPGDLLINELLAGQIQLAAAPVKQDPWPWMVLAVSINVAHHPDNPEPERFNSIHASGEADDVRAVDVLEHFARHFLRWINLWADDGFSAVRTAWNHRARDLNSTRQLDIAGRALRGQVRGLGEHGELLLDVGSNRMERISIRDYFEL